MSVWLKDSLGLEEGLQRCTDIGSLYLPLQSRFALIDTAPLQTVATTKGPFIFVSLFFKPDLGGFDRKCKSSQT